MKLFTLIIGLVFIVSSCAHIYFIEPQPKGGERLYEMPKELYGEWYGTSNGWKLNENGITIANIKTDSVGNILDTTYQTAPLSDSLRIYKKKDLYVVHLKDKSEYWEIGILKTMGNGDIYTYQSSDQDKFASAKGLKLEEATYKINGKRKIVKTLNPEADESAHFLNAVFSGQMKLKTLRKVLKSLTPTIFKADGSIYEEDDSDQEIPTEN